MVEMSKEKFKKKFPSISQELGREGNISLKELLDSKKQSGDMFRGYIPTAIDYLRRCDTKEQAEKTIEYLVKKCEIDKTYGDKLIKQLKERGLRSFGPKKEDEDYLKRAEKSE